MNNILYLLFLASFGLTCAPNKSKKEEVLSDSLKLPYKSTENSLLWEISDNGLAKPSYLFGTIHIIGKDDFFLGENIDKAIQESDLFVTEVALNNLLSINLMKEMMLPEDTSLRDLMSNEEYQKLKTFYESNMKMDESVFELTLSRMSPIVLQQQITVSAFGEKTKSYELELAKIAGNNDLENVGLETADLQMEVLSSVSLSDQVTMLMYTIDSLENANSELYKMIDLYKEQDVKGLSSFMNNSEFSKEFMKHKDDFLTNRNNNWVPQIDSLVQDKVCFIAVGAAHLYDNESGLIQLLQKKGYTVKPIEIN